MIIIEEPNPVSQVNGVPRGFTRNRDRETYLLLITWDWWFCVQLVQQVMFSSTICTGQNNCYLLLGFDQVWRFDFYGELLDETILRVNSGLCKYMFYLTI